MKLPAMQFYPADWRKDPAVQSMNYFDRGVWFEMLCLMHESNERGVLLLNGLPMPDQALANILGLDNQILNQTLTTILTYGVAKRRESDGAVYSKRMVDDEKLCQIRREAGKKGGNPALLNRMVNQNPTTGVNQNPTTGVNQSTTPSSSSSSSSSYNKTNTPLPPKGGVGEDGVSGGENLTKGADAPAASLEKSAGQEMVVDPAGIPVNGDLFGGYQVSTQSAPPAGNDLAGEPPNSATPPAATGRKKAAKPAAEPLVLPEWIRPEDWAAFIEHRIGKKNPMSLEAQRRAIGTIDKLRLEGNDPAAVINQSIVNGWTGFFPVKNNGTRSFAVPQSRQAVRDVLSGMHHGLDKKNYSEGVTADGKWAD